MKSTHEALVYTVDTIYKHPNADQLEIIECEGYTCAVRLGQFKRGDKFIFIVPDTIVSGSLPEFSFLGEGLHRIKVKKLRGLFSQGLIIPTDAEVGSNQWDNLQFQRYEPQMNSQLKMGQQVSGPSIPKYDIDAINKYLKYIRKRNNSEQEYVATEKVHGANARYMYKDKVYCGSRTTWKDKDSMWSECLTPQMEKLITDYPNHVLYGELYGQVQDMKYDKKGVEFIAFDIMLPNLQFMDYDDLSNLLNSYDIPQVPLLYRGSFDYNYWKTLAEEPSMLYNGGKEGLVIKPSKEEYHTKFGRVCFKIVSNWYYTR